MPVRAFLRELPSLGNRNLHRFSKSIASSSSSRHGVRALSGQCQIVKDIDNLVQNHLIVVALPKSESPYAHYPARNGKVEPVKLPPVKEVQPLEKSLQDRLNGLAGLSPNVQMEELRTLEATPFSLELAHFYTQCLSGNILSSEARDHCFSKVFTYAINSNNDLGIREFILSCMPFKEVSDPAILNQSLNLLMMILNDPNEPSDLKSMISKQLCTWIWNTTIDSSLTPLRARVLDALLLFRERSGSDDCVWIINRDLIQAMLNFQKMFTYLLEKPSFCRQIKIMSTRL